MQLGLPFSFSFGVVVLYLCTINASLTYPLGHKNYLYQPLLAKSLPFDTFRFDFRGNGDSDGQMKYADFDVIISIIVAAGFKRE